MAVIGQVLRARSGARFVGVTGSTGKTSTKDILAALCAPVARTVATEGSYNAELGVPLTLGRLEPDTEICIVEMGMRGFGQIAELCEIARPDIGVITAVGPVHLELVGSVDGVARSKAELVAALPEGGIAVVPRVRRPRAASARRHRDPPGRAGRRRASRRRRARRVRRRPDPLPAHVAPPGAERAHRADRVRRARPAARPARRERGGGAALALARGGARASRAAASSSTTPTTRTRPRWRRRCATSPSAERGGASSRSSAAWRSSASTPTGITARSRSSRPSSSIEVVAVGELARGVRGRDVGAGRRRGARRGPRPRSARRRRARQGVPLGRPRRHRPRTGERSRLMSRVFIAGLIAMVISVVIGPKFIDVPAPERARPADPRGGPGGPRGQAGNARDGRPADPALRAPALPRALPLHAARADRSLHDRRLRRDRLPRRLHQAPSPPLARASGPVEAPAARRGHRRRRDSPSSRRATSTPRSTSRSSTSTSRSPTPTTPSSS